VLAEMVDKSTKSVMDGNAGDVNRSWKESGKEVEASVHFEV